MSEPVALISASAINHEDLAAFIVDNNGVLTGSPGLFGRFSDGPRHIWIGSNPEELASSLEDGGPEYAASLARLLGGPPQTSITVEISREPGSEALALDFAIALGQRWPIVLDDLEGSLLTRDDLIQRRAANEGITRPTR